MPKEKHIQSYNGRLYVGGFSNEISFSSEPVAGAITWNTSLDTAIIGSSDESITGLTTMFNLLIVFKTNSIWSWNETSSNEIASIGCKSSKSIQKIGNSLYWINNNGIYKWSGGEPILISKKVQPFLDGIENEQALRATISTVYNLEYRVYVGNVTVDGYEYKNTWLCFDTIKEKWYIRCTGDDVTSSITYNPFGGQETLFGSSNGYVYEFANSLDEIYNDDNMEIDSFFITHNLDHGSPSTINNNPEITVFSENPQGMKMAIQIDNSGHFDTNNVSILNKNIEEIQLNASGRRFKYKFYESSRNASWKFEGFVVDIKEKEDRR